MDVDALYREHARPLAAYFRRRTNDPQVAADLVAETFAAALASKRKFDPGRGPATAWLYGIAKHQLSSWQRSGRVQDRARRRLGMERLELSEVAADRFEGEALAALDTLSEGDRAVIRARVIDGAEYHEIATATGASEPAVRQRVSRALARLRKELTT